MNICQSCLRENLKKSFYSKVWWIIQIARLWEIVKIKTTLTIDKNQGRHKIPDWPGLPCFPGIPGKPFSPLILRPGSPLGPRGPDVPE